MRKNNAITMILALGLVVTLVLMSVQSTDSKISVTGTYEEEVTPDMAEVYIRIATESENAAQAEKQNDETSQDVIDALDYEIETSSYRLQRKEEWNPELRKSEFEGYEAIHVLKVTTQETDSTGIIIQEAVDAGANGVDRVVFDLSEETRSQKMSEALAQASKDAKNRAESLADSLGIRLGKIHQVSESNFDYIPYARSMAEVSDGSIQPGKVSVTATVSVSYNI